MMADYGLGSSGPLVLVDDAAEDVVPAKRGALWGHLGRAGDWRSKVQPSMWPCGVIMGNVGPDDVFEVPSAEDEDPVEAFGSGAFHKSFGVRIRPRCANRAFPRLDAG